MWRNDGDGAHLLTNEGDACIIQAIIWLGVTDPCRRAGKGFGAMAGRAPPTACLSITASVLIALGLVGCLWALNGLSRVDLSPASPAASTVTPFWPMTFSPTARSVVTLLALASFEAQRIAPPLPSPSWTIRPTITPVARRAPALRSAGASSQEAAPAMGALAPDFSLSQVGEGKMQLSALRGPPAVLSFWATWCPSYCRRQIPVLSEAYARHRSRGWLSWVWISLRGRRRSLQRRWRSRPVWPGARAFRFPSWPTPSMR